MKGALQRKFIRTAMVAVTALLVVLLGTINFANWWQVEVQTDRMLSFLLQEELPPEDMLPRDPGRFLPPLNADTRGAARFFQVFYDQAGQVVWVDVGQIATVSEEEALDYAQRCQGQQEGSIDRFRFRRAATQDGQGEVLLFLDTSTSRRSILTVLALSGGVGLLCWLGSFLLVVLLSRRAIAPVVRGMEKQRQFVTNAGHEIKTPLAIIQVNTEALELHQGESKWTRNIRAQTARLTGLMENLLTLARMDEARLPPAQPVDLSGTARESVQAFQEAAGARQLTLTGQIAPGIILQTSREHMVQLLSVLLDNGVKYTEEGGSIRLTLTREGNTVRLQVRNGPTQVPEGDLSRLFDRFCRGDPARSQRTGGYGIGLSAAQAIVQAWQGTIGVRAEGEDTLVFTVTF
ncbi:MAG TPA: HAMP domain-containing histidine kinase [Candidatus Evtepia faecigallinarum]|nr:HAMP domain-containing histidine kinase [Candidatus Evtepia faecigallinarum]